MLENNNSFETPISTLGESKLIDQLVKNFVVRNESTFLGVGDDAGVIQSNKKILISTDLLIEGIHFDLSYVPLKYLGYKSVIINLSNIVAMNGTPTQILVSLAVSNRFPVESLEQIYLGIKTACDKYQIDLIGGDTTSSHSGLTISITSIGNVKESRLVKRSGANSTDLIVITGDLGGAYCGLKVLQREKVTFQSNPNFQPDLTGYEYVIQRHLKPEARCDIVKIFDELNILPTSMIDVSDGLSSDLLHLSKNSKKGFQIYEKKIPLDNQTIYTSNEFSLNPTIVALNGGEDYELLFTVALSDYEKIKKCQHFNIIGHVLETNFSSSLITRNGDEVISLMDKDWSFNF